ncbi:DEAD/DEAH box helicase family protein [Comamonas aquatica]|uniref:DEAD/DEAH box helicase family protein n=1 Tax=Comamonas aquatica TaxID=225991 RepID=A0AA42W0G9_9BURK|nr:DEAD/DEAH box helicase family protein [Comamonas aquatica]MDH1427348.1 DEAD/DEAH box helicase family protein [Comamonas aquatica]MDH1605026.1 DEAD/DEAH box helicase family protein [Comamonas aquatica]MDH1617142.1 DEAD/DEAH box helicase family protein [Comamonas aquatica]MDH2005042.1 DEAD/DEAH box helicase family protein [Comamonas aquatica]
MLTLKTYQQSALAALTDFLTAARSQSVVDAYGAALTEQNRVGETYHPLFGDVPCVCLRVPTGGGKTIMAAHAVALAGKAVLDSEAPIALWLTPSDTIRSQTLEALANARHPYRQALVHYFGDRVQVCDLESLQTISPHDVGKTAIVIVATIQSFNVTDTAKRNVYSFFEELAPHFDNLPPNLSAGLEKVSEADLLSQPYLTAKDVGRVKYSVANWMHLQRPIVIVDEAHNNRTDRFFKSLGRVNPSCVIEMTATPVPGNNVLYHVAAAELKAEQMIKLPIVLAEHPQGWRECLRDARLTRDRLELIAQREPDYLRPIALVQAMPINGEATVAVVRQHLIEQEAIPENQIAVATGTQKELDGINLFDPACPIRYVITVEALKEGWDCSFAYVLASLQSVNSSKDVEQLLGRVLRMPYAKNRTQNELNRAYAHIVADNFAQAAATLKDRMVQNMGFEKLETASIIIPQQSLPLTGGAGGAPASVGHGGGVTKPAPVIPDCNINLPQVPDTAHWPDEIKAVVQIRQTTQGATLLLSGNVSSELLTQAEAFIIQGMPAKTTKDREKQAEVKDQFNDHRAVRQAMRAPAQLGLDFVPIPQLCLTLDGHLEVVERETLSSLGDWSLLDSQVQLAGFSITETVNSFEIDINGAKVIYKHTDAQQLLLNETVTHISQQDLIRWLDVEVRQPDIGQTQMQAYLVKMVTHLTAERGFTLTALVRARFQLAQALIKEIGRLRQIAMTHGFQGRLMDMAVPGVTELAHYSFHYQPGQYPARQMYQGSYEFGKHFYPVIHDLHEKRKSGAPTEEFSCAMAIDVHPKVKQWVRNIERQEKFSFWLPTATDYFYPDFVAELTDGRILAVEYKGEPYKTNDDSREKQQVGHQWEQSSDGRCLFLFAVERDDLGRDVFQQLDHKLG